MIGNMRKEVVVDLYNLIRSTTGIYQHNSKNTHQVVPFYAEDPVFC